VSDESRKATFDRLLDAARSTGRITNSSPLERMWSEHPAVRDHLETIVRELGQGAVPSAATRLDIAYDDLVEDNQLLDYVVRAICLERDCDYLTALEQLWSWHELHNGQDKTLRAIIEESSPISFGQLRRDVVELERSAGAADGAMILSADLTPQPSGETNEHGQVILAEGADRARLLTDSYELERAFLAARDLSPTRYAHREAFEAEYRLHVEAGVDLVATLQLDQHNAEVGRQQARKQTAQQRREQGKREERARRREAAEAVRKNLEKL
jgi:hypothetical protein